MAINGDKWRENDWIMFSPGSIPASDGKMSGASLLKITYLVSSFQSYDLRLA